MSTLFDRIVASGNRPPLRPPYGAGWTAAQRENWITCADGFKLSVLAGDGTYCKPRPGDYPILGEVPADYSGPYTAVEVGYPSERPEPWDQWSAFAEDADDPTDTLYPYVPAELVRALIESHGGAS